MTAFYMVHDRVEKNTLMFRYTCILNGVSLTSGIDAFDSHD